MQMSNEIARDVEENNAASEDHMISFDDLEKVYGTDSAVTESVTALEGIDLDIERG